MSIEVTPIVVLFGVLALLVSAFVWAAFFGYLRSWYTKENFDWRWVFKLTPVFALVMFMAAVVQEALLT